MAMDELSYFKEMKKIGDTSKHRSLKGHGGLSHGFAIFTPRDQLIKRYHIQQLGTLWLVRCLLLLLSTCFQVAYFPLKIF